MEMFDPQRLHIKYLNRQPYETVWKAMRLKNKLPDWNCDELWLVEHDCVFTLGSQGGMEHLLNPNLNIPIIATDRGGSITYHGPGQLVIYPLLHIRSHNLPLKTLIDRLELSIQHWMLTSLPNVYRIHNQRGLYIEQKKIASLGLRIANARTYHGISVNIDMDLTAFDNINPCGYPDLRMTQWTDHAAFPTTWYASLEQAFCKIFGYTTITRDHHNDRTIHSEITWPRQTS